MNEVLDEATDRGRYAGADYLLPSGPDRDFARLRAEKRTEVALEERRKMRDRSDFVARWLTVAFLLLGVVVFAALVWAVRHG